MGRGEYKHEYKNEDVILWRRKMNQVWEEETGKRKQGRGKREEGRGKREEGRGKREAWSIGPSIPVLIERELVHVGSSFLCMLLYLILGVDRGTVLGCLLQY